MVLFFVQLAIGFAYSFWYFGDSSLHPASGPELPHYDGHTDNGDGSSEGQKELVEDVGDGKGRGSLLGLGRVHVEVLEDPINIQATAGKRLQLKEP